MNLPRQRSLRDRCKLRGFLECNQAPLSLGSNLLSSFPQPLFHFSGFPLIDRRRPSLVALSFSPSVLSISPTQPFSQPSSFCSLSTCCLLDSLAVHSKTSLTIQKLSPPKPSLFSRCSFFFPLLVSSLPDSLFGFSS